MISAPEAWARLLPNLGPLPAETVHRRRALGRVLTRPLDARVAVPPEDVSAMDGYALAPDPGGGEVAAGACLPVAGTVAAGDPPGFALSPGEAVRIMTGAPVPAAADRVIPVELTDDGHETVELRQAPKLGAHIRLRGEILEAGDALLPAGSLLGPSALALLATHGYEEVPVVRAPRVAVLVTGDEVVTPDVEPRPGQLRDCHTDFLLGAGLGLGLEFEALGIAPDRPEELAEMVREGLGFDVLLMTGGVSMGEFDLVEGVLKQLGCEILFEKVSIQPAKPVVAAVHPGGLVFGLPGNPASAMVAFWLFVRPALRRLMGGEDDYWQGALSAKLAAPLPGAKGRDRFLSAGITFEGGRLLVAPHVAKGSHDQAAYARGTALVRVPAYSKPRQPGESCEVLPLVDWRPA